MNRIYLDYAASTPVEPEVLEAMRPYFSEKFGNPGSLHSFGQEVMAAVDASRETIARVIGADFREIIFTGSATEANNLAIRGIARGIIQNLKIKNQNDNLKFKVNSSQANTKILHFDFCTLNFRPRIIASSIEHESILETRRDLEKFGVEVVYLPVDRRGVVDLEALRRALNERTVLVSVMYANNEIGTVQPLAEIAEIIKEFRKRKISARHSSEAKPMAGGGNRSKKNSIFYFLDSSFYPLFHTDAAQAFQFLDCDINKLGVDLMTLSSHKIYGPKGAGALYVSQESGVKSQESGVRSQESGVGGSKNLTHDSLLLPLITGGGQEFGLRSGTENTPSIVGFAKAVEIVISDKRQATSRIAKLRDYFWRELKKIYPKAELNGPKKNSERLPSILNVYFPGHKSEDLLAKFDLAGLAVSAGSACRSRAVEGSYVIEALGYSKERAKQSIRFSLGRPTTKREIDLALKIIKISLKQ
jgi:cysteine desulfurase